MAVWSNEAVEDFIKLYKSHTCLWKVKSPEYKNRSAKQRAYGELVDLCRSFGFKSANADTVKKKVQSLRGAFRKELRKLLASMENGAGDEEVYKPNLWYFDLLLFTKDQEINEGDTGDDGDDNGEDIEEECNSNEGQWEVKPVTFSIPSYTESTNAVNNTSYGASTSRTNQNGLGEDNNEINYAQRSDRKRKIPVDSSAGFVNICSGMSLSDISETEAFGISVARKLQRMKGMQSLYAETIIGTVLRKGLMNKLTEETDVCDNQCSKNFID